MFYLFSSPLLSLFGTVLMVIFGLGVGMSGYHLYGYLAQHPKLNRGHAGAIAFFTVGMSVLIMTTPFWLLIGGIGAVLRLIGLFCYLYYGGTGLFYIWKWGSELLQAFQIVKSKESGCGCTGKKKKDTSAPPSASPSSTTEPPAAPSSTAQPTDQPKN